MQTEQEWEPAKRRLGYENRMERNDQLCFPELFRSGFAVLADRPRLQSAAAVDLLEASKRIGPVSAPGNAMGQDFWELNWGFKTSGGDCKGHLLHVISRIFPGCVDWTGEKYISRAESARLGQITKKEDDANKPS